MLTFTELVDESVNLLVWKGQDSVNPCGHDRKFALLLFTKAVNESVNLLVYKGLRVLASHLANHCMNQFIFQSCKDLTPLSFTESVFESVNRWVRTGQSLNQ